jgi:hypothetical protein
VQLLNVINDSDKEAFRVGQNQASGIALTVQQTHFINCLQVDIRKNQFLIGRKNNGWAIAAGKNVDSVTGKEALQLDGTGT